MRKRLASILFAGAAAVAAVTIVAPSAFASGGVSTVTPGGAYKASLNSGTSTLLQDNNNGLSVTCTVSSAAGSLKTPPTGSNNLGTITGITWSSCSGLGGLVSAGSASGNNLPWTLSGTGYNGTVDGGQTTGAIATTAGNATDGWGVGATIKLTILGSPCTAIVGGKSSTTSASAVGLYDNTPALLATTGTSNLVVLSSNCSGLKVGDSTTFFTSPTSTAGKAVTHGYLVNPAQKITDP